MRTKKPLLIVLGLVLLLLVACVLALRWRRESTTFQRSSETSAGPSFEIRVETPLFAARPPWEIPGVILGFRERGPRLDQTSPGTRIGNVAPNHLELSAEDWDLSIEADAAGRLAAGTYILFPVKLGDRRLKFNCRPGDPPSGYLSTTSRSTGEIDGSFVLDLKTCINAQSGKTSLWPGGPLTVKGSFAGLRQASH